MIANEIRVRRCHLRVVRRGGWSWGPDPPALLRAVLDALPSLLASRLADLYPAPVDEEIPSPVRVRIRATAGELRELAAARGTHSLASDPEAHATTALVARVDAALRRALPEADTHRPDSPTPALTTEEPARLPNEPGTSLAGRHLVGILEAWYDAHVLEPWLRVLSPAARRALRHLLADGRRGAIPLSLPAEPGDFRIQEIAGQVVRSLRGSLPARDDTVLWILAAAAVARQCSLSMNDPAIVATLEELLPPPRDEAPAVPLALEEPGAPSPVRTQLRGASTRRATAPRRRSPRRPTASTERETLIASALPYLLLGPLSRVGFLEALGALMTSAGLVDQLPLFAVALAYKVLPPPERGWRRSADVARAAAVFADLELPPEEAELHELDRRASPLAELLSGTLTQTLIAGHTPATPLAVIAVDPGLVLLDADGAFPLAWSADPAALLSALQALDGETLVVPRPVASTSTLRTWHDGGVMFVTDAPPTRGEPWLAIRTPLGERWYTNDTRTSETVLANRASVGMRTTAHGEAFWQAISVDRPAFPVSPDSSLERTLTLTAGVGLAAIAWALWPGSESSSPATALTRFADLDARVRSDERMVHVRVPLGRRHADLSSHGLLDPVRDVPWLAGRIVELGGG
jgi:hypothetical protein